MLCFVQYQSKKAFKSPTSVSWNSNGTSKRRQGRGRIGKDLGSSNIPFQTLRAVKLWNDQEYRSSYITNRKVALRSMKITQTMTYQMVVKYGDVMWWLTITFVGNPKVWSSTKINLKKKNVEMWQPLQYCRLTKDIHLYIKQTYIYIFIYICFAVQFQGK